MVTVGVVGPVAALAVVAAAPITHAADTAAAATSGFRRDIISSTSFVASARGRRPSIG
jgi:hypothetical protein